MTRRNTTKTLILRSSHGTHLLDHLAADGAGFPGGQVTIVTVGQVDAYLGSCLHLELVHGLTGLRNVDLIVILATHNLISHLIVFRKACRFPLENDFFLSVTLV